jgi:hypothetical protein
MAYISNGLWRLTPRRAASVLLACSIVLGMRSATVACVLYDPNETPKVVDLGPTPVPPLTTKELAEILRKARMPQAEAVATLPGFVQESTLDFLGGATYLKVTLDRAFRSEIYHFVRKDDRLNFIPPGREGWNEIVNHFDVSVRDPDTALRYVQWFLDATSEGSFWLVQSVDGVPFLPENREDKSHQARIAEARAKLEGKVEAPRVEAKEGVYLVQQDAVVGRSLVRYTVRVSKLGLPTVETTTLAEDLPVVSVG